MELSIIVPVLNEAESLRPLYDQIRQAVGGRYDYEIVFIDDGSSDNSFSVLSEILQNDPRMRIIRFRRNFGQTAALSAGFEHARGNIIIALDADGQNDPADIPKLIEKLEEGYDIVSGWRRKRHDKVLTRKFPSWVANRLIAAITGVKLHDFGCTLKAYRASSLKEIRLYGEMHRFIPALASWSGEKVTELVVNHRPRTRGKPKYGLARTLKVILDLITIKFLMSFSTKPIYVFGGLGVLSILGASLSGAAVLYQKFISASHLSMNKNPLLVLTAIFINASVQFILMGLLAEMLVRTYHESQDRPIYVIEKIFESDDKVNEA
ncbi:MAG: glycosyltransferase [Planctomycetota bacterium]|nr:MAG: glycosyltransferase [Planctomycetota bacterium]